MHILQIGCDTIRYAGTEIRRPAGTAGYLLLITQSPMELQIGSEVQQADRDIILLLDKHTPHRYVPTEDSLRYDWVHFDTDFDADFFRSLNIPLNAVRQYGDVPFIRSLLRNLCAAYYSETPRRMELLDGLLKTMLIKISEIVSISSLAQVSDPHYSTLVQLRESIYKNPKEKWSVDVLAGIVNMSRSYFQLMYREAFGITCISDVITCKMNYAKELLTTTDYTIAAVASQCGYDNEEHFMRLFKKNIGVTPTVYRKNCKQQKK